MLNRNTRESLGELEKSVETLVRKYVNTAKDRLELRASFLFTEFLPEVQILLLDLRTNPPLSSLSPSRMPLVIICVMHARRKLKVTGIHEIRQLQVTAKDSPREKAVVCKSVCNRSLKSNQILYTTVQFSYCETIQRAAQTASLSISNRG